MRLRDKIFWSLAGLGGIYAIFMGAMLNPQVQRFALYANSFSTTRWDDLDDGESFGFAGGQVRALNISTPDRETLYAWHVLPLRLYDELDKRRVLLNEVVNQSVPYEDSTQYKFLREDPESQVIISFHGNAGHLANGFRKENYRSLSSATQAHIIAFDYRGFGRSTGSPTEEGLITDGIAVVNFVINTLNIPPHRITILAQSLGTAVSSAVALHFADSGAATRLLPSHSSETSIVPKTTQQAVGFRSIILVAPFTSIPTLMKTYRILGIIPVLSPLRFYSWIEEFLITRIVDKWNTQARVAALFGVYRSTPKLLRLNVHIIHAINDFDIPYRHSEGLAYVAVNASSDSELPIWEFEKQKRDQIDVAKGGFLEWDLNALAEPDHIGKIRLEIVRYGGHNSLGKLAPVTLAVKRALGEWP